MGASNGLSESGGAICVASARASACVQAGRRYDLDGVLRRLRSGCLRSGVGLVLVAAAALGFSASAFAESKTFEPGKGSEQEFNVPAGVTQLHVTAIGGAGQPGTACLPGGSGPGGAGAKVTATLPVSEGETVYIDFGEGASGGAQHCSLLGPGGDGGGASDVRTVSGSLASRLVVAGGGGGGGDGSGEFEEITA